MLVHSTTHHKTFGRQDTDHVSLNNRPVFGHTSALDTMYPDFYQNDHTSIETYTEQQTALLVKEPMPLPTPVGATACGG